MQYLLALLLLAAEFPAPTVDTPAPPAKQKSSIVLAGGCFWGVDAVYRHVQGVTEVVSGYSGGSRLTANYATVSTGFTSHAESVKITFDPSRVTLGKLLHIYFSVAHDPTELNRQGPDEGPQYRSAIFFTTDEQKRVAEAYIQQLNQAKVFSRPIVTQVTPLAGFYAAEEYHQNYIARNPGNPYVVYNDLPKLKRLHQSFPELWTGK
ncbi:MAG: peptide-methionine (S)-S-oxide reductase MsrA [Acidobacteriota bacterium]|nr:peptide-methionine (S)-S-oxide reductase MsrA [Acidobacteriota bacterium]